MWKVRRHDTRITTKIAGQLQLEGAALHRLKTTVGTSKLLKQTSFTQYEDGLAAGSSPVSLYPINICRGSMQVDYFLAFWLVGKLAGRQAGKQLTTSDAGYGRHIDQKVTRKAQHGCGKE